MDIEQVIRWLEQTPGAALVSDDNGHWAVSFDGFQPVTGEKFDQPVTIQVDVDDPSAWQDSIYSAILYAINKVASESSPGTLSG